MSDVLFLEMQGPYLYPRPLPFQPIVVRIQHVVLVYSTFYRIMGSFFSKKQKKPKIQFNQFLGIPFREMAAKIKDIYPESKVTTVALKEGDVLDPNGLTGFIVTYNALTWAVTGVWDL